MSRFGHEVAYVCRHGAAGKILVAVGGASVLWAFVILLGALLGFTRFRFGERTRRVCLWSGVVLAAVVVSSTFALVHAARASYLSVATPYLQGGSSDVGPSERARLVGVALSVTYATTRIAADALAALAFGVLAGAVFWVRGPARAILVSSALAGLVIAYALLSRHVVQCFPDEAGMWPLGDRFRCLTERNDANTRLLISAKAAVVALAAVLASLAIGLVLRGGGPQARIPSTHMLAGVFLFVLGASTFAFTRASAHDAAQKPEVPYEGESCSYLDFDLPPANGECAPADGPIVLISDEATFVDGIPVTPAELRNVLDSKASLWRQVNPGHHFGGTALVAAPRGIPPRDVLPWLREIEASDYGRAGAITALPDRFAQTASLGTVRYSKRCCFETIPLGTTANEGALARFRTWGDFVASLEPPK